MAQSSEPVKKLADHYSRVSNNRDHHGTFTSLKVTHITLLLADITHTRGAAQRAQIFRIFSCDYYSYAGKSLQNALDDAIKIQGSKSSP